MIINHGYYAFFLSQSQLVGGPVDQLVDQLIGWSVDCLLSQLIGG